jgi:hypothetical protein
MSPTSKPVIKKTVNAEVLKVIRKAFYETANLNPPNEGGRTV